MIVDVDLANAEMDRIQANTYGEHTGVLNVSGVNLLSDAPSNKYEVDVYFADAGLKDYVTEGFGSYAPDTGHQSVVYTPIYKYEVSYDNRNNAGYFVFKRDGGVEPYNEYNPSALDSVVAAQAGAEAAITQAFGYVFNHVDTFTKLPKYKRLSLINSNKYAAASPEFNNNMPNYLPVEENKAFWVKPYTSFENMPLKRGPKADVISYGTLIGADSDFRELKHGWANVGSAYVGYNGGLIKFGGTSTAMNGGLLGITETFYKNNFWTAITASVGASVGEATNMYGREHFTNLLGGIGSKTGYNIEFKDGKYILQPMMFLGYSFVNTFDYTNSAGVKIKSDPMHTITLNPSIRFVSNLKNGWQPYASVGMVWNLINETHFSANGETLPKMHVKPYVEYGLGIQRVWADKFTAFGQAMVRNNGKNGIAFTFGFRWALGRDGATKDKVQNVKHSQPVNKVKKYHKAKKK
jgi:outer membrane autotransporter protein